MTSLSKDSIVKRLLLVSTCLTVLTIAPLHAQDQPAQSQPAERPAAPKGAQPRADQDGEIKRPGVAPRDAMQAEPAGKAAAGAPRDGDSEPLRKAPGREETPARNGDEAAPAQRPASNATRKAEPEPAAQGETPRRTAEPKPKPDAPRNAETGGTTSEGKPARKPGAEQAGKDAGGQEDKPRRNGDATKPDRAARTTDNARPARAEGRVNLDERRAGSLHRELVGGFRGEQQRVDVDIRVGVALPERVMVRALPPEIVTEYPEFRGYDFFVEEDQVVIVEPGTREVVEVIGGGGGAVADDQSGAPRHRFGRDQNEAVRRVVTEQRSTLAVGAAGPVLRAPESANIRPLPRAMADAMQDADAYGYFLDRENRVVVVDRGTREVIDIVD